MEVQDLVIEISDLAHVPGASKHIHRLQPIAGLGGPLAWVEDDDPVDISLEAASVSEGIAVSGSVSGRVHFSCSRCLVDFSRRFDQRIDETFYYDRQRATKMDGYEIQNMAIDLEPMLRDVIVLGMPINPLHTSECRGLCAVCGQDLNVVECGHSRVSADVRWAPLKGMLSEQPKS